MAVTAGTAYYSSADSSTHAVAYPSTGSGDRLVLCVTSITQNVSSITGSWTESNTGITNGSVSLFSHVYYKTATGSESGTETITLDASSGCCAVIINLDGTNGGNFDDSSFSQGSGIDTAASPADTAAQSNSTIIRMFSCDASGGSAAGATIPSGTTLIQQGDVSSGTVCGMATAWETDTDTTIASASWTHGFVFWNTSTIMVSPAAAATLAPGIEVFRTIPGVTH